MIARVHVAPMSIACVTVVTSIVGCVSMPLADALVHVVSAVCTQVSVVVAGRIPSPAVGVIGDDNKSGTVTNCLGSTTLGFVTHLVLDLVTCRHLVQNWVLHLEENYVRIYAQRDQRWCTSIFGRIALDAIGGIQLGDSNSKGETDGDVDGCNKWC